MEIHLDAAFLRQIISPAHLHFPLGKRPCFIQAKDIHMGKGFQ